MSTYAEMPRALCSVLPGLLHLLLSYCAKDIHTLQRFLCQKYAQQNKLDGLLCTATLGFPGNLGKTLGLRPRVILGCLRQPRLRMCRGGYSLSVCPTWDAGPQVGASNELPESEELDALYDRFLIRRKVGQVSDAGLVQLLGSSAVQQAAISSFSTSASDSGSIAFQQQDFANIRYASGRVNSALVSCRSASPCNLKGPADGHDGTVWHHAKDSVAEELSSLGIAACAGCQGAARGSRSSLSFPVLPCTDQGLMCQSLQLRSSPRFSPSRDKSMSLWLARIPILLSCLMEPRSCCTASWK